MSERSEEVSERSEEMSERSEGVCLSLFSFPSPPPHLWSHAVCYKQWIAGATAYCFPSPVLGHSQVFLHGCKIKSGSGLRNLFHMAMFLKTRAGYNYQAGQG